MRLSAVQVTAGAMFWVEARPNEGGRMVVVGRNACGTRDWVPSPFNARTLVHEYGGGAYCVGNDTLWFVDFSTQKIVETRGDGRCRVVTESGAWRLADLVFDAKNNQLLAVGERHDAELQEPENAIVTIDLLTGEIAPLVTGRNFYASPRLCPQAQRLAYLAWDHPFMPWDAAELWVCDLQDTINTQHLGGDSFASAFGPAWSPEGKLAFAWERSGRWDVYTWTPAGGVELMLATQEEFALPLWSLGMSTLAWLDAETLVAAGTANGSCRVVAVNARTQAALSLVTDLPAVTHLHAGHGVIAAIASAPTVPSAVVQIHLQGGWTVIQSSLSVESSLQDWFSPPHAFSFPTTDSNTAFAFFYPPCNPLHCGPDGALPPLLLIAHSGPTAQSHPAFNPAIAFWTSRGFAVIDVNYRGSTGYGRIFRDKLRKQWGVADVQDCVAAATFAAQQDWVNGRQMVIRGSSAGGFTVLAALCFHKVFAAGASLYGVTDLASLARDTHKFESHYLEQLIGPYPEQADLYARRSPLHSAALITAPVIFFAGMEDKVVPPSQAETMFRALRDNGVATDFVTFEHEQHGFRRAETIVRVYTDELAFYQRALGIAASL